MRTSTGVNNILQNQIDALFYQTLADIKSPEEAKTFVNDFLSETERDNLAKRLAIAYWLKKGRSYKNIKDNLKVSSATVAAVQTIVNKKGIETALKKLEAEEWASEWSEKIKKIVGK